MGRDIRAGARGSLSALTAFLLMRIKLLRTGSSCGPVMRITIKARITRGRMILLDRQQDAAAGPDTTGGHMGRRPIDTTGGHGTLYQFEK